MASPDGWPAVVGLVVIIVFPMVAWLIRLEARLIRTETLVKILMRWKNGEDE